MRPEGVVELFPSAVAGELLLCLCGLPDPAVNGFGDGLLEVLDRVEVAAETMLMTLLPRPDDVVDIVVNADCPAALEGEPGTKAYAR